MATIRGLRLLPIGLLLIAACTAQPAARPSAAPAPAASGSGASPAEPAPAGAAAATAPAPPPQRAHVIAGYIPTVAAAPFYVGLDRGYFEAEGVDLDSENVAVTTEALTQAAAGNLHVANITVGVAALNIFASGIDIKIVGGTFGTAPSGPHAFPLLVRKALHDSGEVRDASELRGRKVALNGTGVFSEYAVDAALRTGGLTISDVDVQIMSFPDMPVALSNAAVDAAFPPEPFSTQAVDLGVAVPLVTDYLHGVQGGVMVAGEAFLKERPALEAFLRAYLRSLRDLEREGYTSPAIAALIEKYTKVPAAVLQKTLPQYNDPEMRINLASLMDQQRFYMDRGYLHFTEPLDLNQFIDDGPRTAALRALGAR
ncbi:MAG TPA: ABC transporter substrate-binding protein [Chloroflexota bacterium]|nr:ABC transporter substrate-binding protein [Chloroflexota bacterium]